jgi:hypothetical protein
MKHTKFLIMVAAATVVFLQGCSPYEKSEQRYTLQKGQKSALMVLGEAEYINLYNVKEPIKLVIKAPKDKKIYYKSNNTYATEHVMELNPRDKFAAAFELENKDGVKEPINFRLNAYKSESSRPVNASEIKVKSGKYYNLAGYNMFYSLGSEQNKTEIDLDDFNSFSKYSFNYKGNTDKLEIKIIPPKDTVFVFSNGKTQDSYIFDLKGETVLGFTLKHKDVKETYSRNLQFSLETQVVSSINKEKLKSPKS